MKTLIQPDGKSFGVGADVRGAALGVLSRDGRFISANDSAAALFGYQIEDLIGKSVVDLASDADQQGVVAGLSLSASGTPHSFNAILHTRNGRRTSLMLHQQTILDNAGHCRALLTIFEEPVVGQRQCLEAAPCSETDSRQRYAHLMIGQEWERKRISSELHDGLGQALTLIKLMVENSLRRMRQGDVDEATGQLDTVVLHMRDAIGEVHHICSELRPVLLDRLGLAVALESLCRRVAQGSQTVAVVFECDVEEHDIPDNLKADMFRIAQEAMNNAMKHGAATEIRLTVQRVEAGILLTIQDNGIGLGNLPVTADPSTFSGLGLIGMQQRVELNGGAFFICCGDGGGTLVSAIWKM
ncbi:histidine kinase [Pandoraea terrae]|nr:histidine kinase [Pandoraea terrae]